MDVFAAMPDFRKARGKRHPFQAIFALACCAMVCGARSSRAIADWGRNDGTRLAQALGFTHATPCAAPLHTIFRHVNRDAFEAHLGAWADRVVGSLPAAPEMPGPAVALAGPTRRGSTTPGAPGTHLFSARAHQVGVTLAQHAVDDHTQELTVVETLFYQWVWEGRMVTMDALLTQRQVAQTIGDAGGDAVLIVKEHQPQLKAASALVFPLPPAGDRQESVRTGDVGHGRLETRTLTTSEALVGYSDWPGLAHGCEVGRQVITQKTGTERVEVV